MTASAAKATTGGAKKIKAKGKGKGKVSSKAADRAAKRAAMQANFGKAGASTSSKAKDAEAAERTKMKKAMDAAKKKVGDLEAAAKLVEDTKRATEKAGQDRMLKARSKLKAVMEKVSPGDLL
jgi:hypothetical protein